MFDISNRPIRSLFGFGSKFSNTCHTKNTCQAPTPRSCRNYAKIMKLCRNYAEI